MYPFSQFNQLTQAEVVLLVFLIFVGAATVWGITWFFTRNTASIQPPSSKQPPFSYQDLLNYELELTCPKCGVSMESGFIPESRGVGTFFNMWVKGKPEWHSFPKSLKITQGAPISTYRCPSCGYLESYAIINKVD